MKIVCLSDTHSRQEDLNVPDGDLLIHAGDFTMRGSEQEVRDFNTWLGTLPHRHKVVIAGNHDWALARYPYTRDLITNAIYLENSGCTIEGLKIWGSPATPNFFDWAFNYARGGQLRRIWEAIPDDIDILVTHGPAHGILDEPARIIPFDGWSSKHVGCEDLLDVIQKHPPRLHVFGHIHEGAGFKYVKHGDKTTLHVNASALDKDYHATIQILRFDLKTEIP